MSSRNHVVTRCSNNITLLHLVTAYNMHAFVDQIMWSPDATKTSNCCIWSPLVLHAVLRCVLRSVLRCVLRSVLLLLLLVLLLLFFLLLFLLLVLVLLLILSILISEPAPIGRVDLQRFGG